ncbi:MULTISPECIES: hypothetical protein [unclassified Streptomyces]|uniref:hypothetical protein n=1 Tax=unclassified Streptomyces TaxID=2593676 RepID=UPI00039F953C|nr:MULTISPECIES: hypothetical protein [unclassified Streptomyces]MYS33567.1 hypothetical protein [Streptomyces sp. SID4920]MYX63840.1 hypothetical protein [Streptomyces sp. SID8373]
MTAEDADKARNAIADLERIERLVTTVLVILGVGGLIFTAVNVTLFAKEHHVHWAIAWMLDPLVSVSLLAALFIDGKLSSHGYRPGGWPFALRWFAGLATWLMNCWGSLYPDAVFTGWPDRPDPAGLLLHSVIPVLVIFLAEAGAGYRKFAVGRKSLHLNTLSDWKDQEEARRKADADEARRRAEADRADKEAERKRAADLAAEEKRAAIEAQKARDLADAEARKIRAESEAEARRAAQARADAEARRKADAEDEERRRIAAAEEARLATEAREQQARIDAENAERAARLASEAKAHEAALERQRILAEAQATATRTQAEATAETERLRAEAQIKADEEAREERRRAAEARRAATADATAIPSAETSGKTRTLSAVPQARTAEADDVRGADAKRKQIEAATFEAAVLVLLDAAPTRKDFAAGYGRGETWGRDRYADADKAMTEDANFAARVLAEAERRTTPSSAHSA